jgi:hypothetical protein
MNMEHLNKELYSQIEHLIITWNIDGTKTAGSLTRDIMNLISNIKIHKGLEIDDLNHLKSGQILILNRDYGDFKLGEEFEFMWSDGLTFVVKPIGDISIYLDMSYINLFYKKN